MERLTKNDIQVIMHIAELGQYRDGTTLELNRTQQRNYPERWDLRRWHLDENGNKVPGKGICLNDKEMEELKAILDENF